VGGEPESSLAAQNYLSESKGGEGKKKGEKKKEKAPEEHSRTNRTWSSTIQDVNWGGKKRKEKKKKKKDGKRNRPFGGRREE